MSISDQNPETVTKSPTTNPAEYWRRLCRVEGSPLYVCGDLPHADSAAAEQLNEWVDEGITSIVDVRIEWNDASRVKRLHPQLRYIWNGVDDAGGDQADEWFDEVVEEVLSHLAATGESAKVVVHCHMGINRGPSMAFAILLALGWEPIAALDAIRKARPIAAIIYADSALRWWHDRRGSTDDELDTDLEKLFIWQMENRIQSDLHWVISRIRLAEDDAA
jgi:dual specificity phosphatase 3